MPDEGSGAMSEVERVAEALRRRHDEPLGDEYYFEALARAALAVVREQEGVENEDEWRYVPEKVDPATLPGSSGGEQLTAEDRLRIEREAHLAEERSIIAGVDLLVAHVLDDTDGRVRTFPAEVRGAAVKLREAARLAGGVEAER